MIDQIFLGLLKGHHRKKHYRKAARHQRRAQRHRVKARR